MTKIKLLAIPSTFTGEEKSMLLRTYKIGQLARIAATFGITDIGVYFDPDPYFESHGLGRFIVKVLKYINTPPYLRKIAFKKDESLRFLGYVEPLNVPHHLDKEFKTRYRYAFILKDLGKKLIVNDGESNLTVEKEFVPPKSDRIVVIDRVKKVTVDRRFIKPYFGYYAFYYNRKLSNLLESLKKRGFLLIGTSRYGEDVRKISFAKRDKMAIIFGSPFRGLREILNNDLKYFDYFVNFIPHQNVKTIRTEEAVGYTLAILRFMNIM